MLLIKKPSCVKLTGDRSNSSQRLQIFSCCLMCLRSKAVLLEIGGATTVRRGIYWVRVILGLFRLQFHPMEFSPDYVSDTVAGSKDCLWISLSSWTLEYLATLF